MDKLFFGEIEKQSAEARKKHMSDRGPHGAMAEPKQIDVAANPGTEKEGEEDGNQD